MGACTALTGLHAVSAVHIKLAIYISYSTLPPPPHNYFYLMHVIMILLLSRIQNGCIDYWSSLSLSWFTHIFTSLSKKLGCGCLYLIIVVGTIWIFVIRAVVEFKTLVSSSGCQKSMKLVKESLYDSTVQVLNTIRGWSIYLRCT